MGACSTEWSEAISALVDDEVTPLERARVEAHLARCAACADTLAAYRAVGDAMRSGADPRVPDRVVQRARALAPRPWRRLATGTLAAAAMLAAGALPSLLPGGFDEVLAHEVSEHHYRAFARGRPCDFESDDPEAVAGWLHDTLGYAVEVPEVPGATLLGARKCRLHGELTAAILYRVGDEALTVFVPRADAVAAQSALDWADDGVRCADGTFGASICVTADDGAVRLAVAELEPAALGGALPR